MSTPTTTQIRDYFAYVDEQQGAIDMTKVTDPESGRQLDQPVQIFPPAPRPQRGWVTALAVIVAIGAVLIPLLFFSGGDDRDVAGTPTTTVTSTTPITAVVAGEWCRIGDEFSTAFAAERYDEVILLEDDWIAAAPSEIAAATRNLIEILSGGPSTFTGRDMWAEPIAEIEAYRGLHCPTADMPGF